MAFEVCCCIPLRAGTFIVLGLHLLRKIYIASQLMVNGWVSSSTIGNSTAAADVAVDFRVGFNYVHIIGIVILLLVISSLIKKKPSTTMLNVAIIFFLVDLISILFKMFMMFKNLEDQIMDLQNDIESSVDEDGYNPFEKFLKTIALAYLYELRKQLIIKIVRAVFLALVIELYSMLVVYCYRVEVEQNRLQSNEPRISQAPIPPRVYYTPHSANGFEAPACQQNPQCSVPSYYDANPHVIGFK